MKYLHDARLVAEGDRAYVIQSLDDTQTAWTPVVVERLTEKTVVLRLEDGALVRRSQRTVCLAWRSPDDYGPEAF